MVYCKQDGGSNALLLWGRNTETIGDMKVPARKLDIAFWNYDRTRALTDGRVNITGVDATYHSAAIVTEIFRRMISERKYDVSELGLTYFLRTFDDGESPFIAIPVFPNRAFRHSAIYINKSQRHR